MLGAWAIADGASRAARRRERARPIVSPRWRRARLSAVALAYAAVEGLDRRWLELRSDYAELRLPVGRRRAGASERARAARAARCATCARDVAPGDPIYVATRRSDLVTSGHPLFYVLADRPNPTRYDIQAPGVVTSAPVQREIVRDLERSRTPLVVRWTAPLTAAPRAKPRGRVQRRDAARRLPAPRSYRPAARFGAFVVLERR